MKNKMKRLTEEWRLLLLYDLFRLLLNLCGNGITYHIGIMKTQMYQRWNGEMQIVRTENDLDMELIDWRKRERSAAK